MKPLIRALRKALYSPVQACRYIPVHPVLHLWLIRQTVAIDEPLRNYLIRGAFDAKSTG